MELSVKTTEEVKREIHEGISKGIFSSVMDVLRHIAREVESYLEVYIENNKPVTEEELGWAALLRIADLIYWFPEEHFKEVYVKIVQEIDMDKFYAKLSQVTLTA